MDHKAWLWKKKSSEKTIFATNKVDNRLRGTEEVLKSHVNNGVGAERSSKALNEKLASVLLDCPVKEDPEPKNDKETIEDVLLSQEKAKKEEEEEEAILLKQQMEQEQKQKQKQEQEQEEKIRDAVATASREYEKERKVLEEKYAEASKKLAALGAENASLAKAILVKENLVEDLSRRKSRAEAEFGTLMVRLDSTEKENAFLKYEFNVVERELRIRNEEMEYYRRSSDALQKQRSESSEKIAKLEQECLRLRGAARKRPNGPPGLGEARRRKPIPSREMVVRESAAEKSPAFERLRAVEEENEALKKVLNRKFPGFDTQLIDTRSEDAATVSSSGSWEHLKNGKHRDLPNRRASEISLMDDFVEMEKLAIVSVDKPSGITQQRQRDRANGKPFDWIQVVLSAMLEQKHISKRSLAELLEDIKIALGFIYSPVTPEANKTAKRLTPKEADPVSITGYLTWNSSEASSIDTSPKEKGNRNTQSSRLSESAGKIIKLIRDINPERDQKLGSETSANYFIRVFQWRNSELNAVLQRFVSTCDDLTRESCDLERFAEDVASSLDWILNNYVAPKEAANARDKIKKHFGWNETERESDRAPSLRSEEQSVESSHSTLQEENERLRDELKGVVSEKADMESRLNLEVEKSKGLEAELEAAREKKGTVEDQIENEKLISGDLDTQLSIAKAKLNEVFQKVSSLEVELEDKQHCCEDLEATCLELQLQLEIESDVAKEAPKKSQPGWEISAASAKLAECQETIVNLGKQLKALATPREAAILDKVFSDTNNTGGPAAIKDKDNLTKRASLRDRMMDEDGAKQATAIISRSDGHNGAAVADSSDRPAAVEPCRSLRCKPGGGGSAALAIVPSKKKGIGFDLLRKLLVRRRRSNGQKSRYSTKV